jgi:hypothetical protein
MNFTPASEPTNIIWENRHIKGRNFYARFSAALLWLFILICGAFAIIYIAKKQSIQNARVYSGVDCSEFKSEIITQNPQWYSQQGWDYMGENEGTCAPKSQASALLKTQPKDIDYPSMDEVKCQQICYLNYNCDAA